jgi:hypothetical protein
VFTAPGVVAIVDVPVITPSESEVVPETKTSPAPPPPPRLPNPPPPPPPTTTTSIAETPVGVVQLHVVTVVKVTVVNPPDDTGVAGLQLANGVPATPVDAGLELEPFSARNKTV